MLDLQQARNTPHQRICFSGTRTCDNTESRTVVSSDVKMCSLQACIPRHAADCNREQLLFSRHTPICSDSRKWVAYRRAKFRDDPF